MSDQTAQTPQAVTPDPNHPAHPQTLNSACEFCIGPRYKLHTARPICFECRDHLDLEIHYITSEEMDDVSQFDNETGRLIEMYDTRTVFDAHGDNKVELVPHCKTCDKNITLGEITYSKPNPTSYFDQCFDEEIQWKYDGQAKQITLLLN